MLEGGLSAGTLKGIYFDNNKFELKKELCQKIFIIYEIRHWWELLLITKSTIVYWKKLQNL